jgi:hypothetical protein
MSKMRNDGVQHQTVPRLMNANIIAQSNANGIAIMAATKR